MFALEPWAMMSYNKIILFVMTLPLFTASIAAGGLQTAYGGAVCEDDDDCDFLITNECTDAVCINPGNEESARCILNPDDSRCDDGDQCTFNVCDEITGCFIEAVIGCSDVQCGENACNPSTGQCEVTPEDLDCDIFNQCTAGFCDINGGCFGDPAPFEGLDCDGGIGLCTDGECIPKDADIHVLKFHDLNGNGERDAGEPVIPGWEIWLQCGDAAGNALEIHGETNEEGLVWFEAIPVPNLCEVSEEQRNGWTPTTPPRVTVDLNSADERMVTFGNVRALETEKFYTETDKDIEDGFFGTLLPFTDDDTQTVQAVIHPKTGKITSYNPGQYYAVTKVTTVVDLATVSIFEEDFLCIGGDKPISKWNPAKVPGGAYVWMMCPDGTTVDLTSELAHADPPQLFRNDFGVLEAHVEDVKAGCMVFLGVKYSPGLKGETFHKLEPQDLLCENVEIVCANLTDEPIPFPGLYNDMIACISDVTDSAHRVLEVVMCGENEAVNPINGKCICPEGFEETPSGICVAAEF